jgi:hypothetical protein
MALSTQSLTAVVTEDEQPSLVGRARPQTRVVAILGSIVMVGITTVYIFISPFAWAACVAVFSGVVAGIELVGFTRTSVEVFPDRIRLVNVMRTVLIRKEAIAGLRTHGGIRILLRNGKWLVPTAFQPNRVKLFVSNPARDREFGEAAAAILGVGAQIPYVTRPEPIPSGSVIRTLRRDSVVAALVGAALVLAYAGALLGLVNIL